MVRFTISIAGALLALAPMAHAKRVSGIWVYPFVTEVCLGNPIGSPLYLEMGECMETQANSVKPMIHVVRTWIQATNDQEMECALATYKTRACTTGDEIEFASLPRMLSQCVMSLEPFTPIQSVKFVCYKKDPAKEVGAVTHWSIGNDFKPTPHVSTLYATVKARATQAAIDAGAPAVTALTESLTVTEGSPITVPKETATAVAAKAPAAPAEHEIIVKDKDERSLHIKRDGKGDHDTLSVWMLHPWSKSMLCYLCYTKERRDFNSFKCTSGPRHVGHCGPPPPSINGEPIPIETKVPIMTDDSQQTNWPLSPDLPAPVISDPLFVPSAPYSPTIPSQPTVLTQPPQTLSTMPRPPFSAQPKPSSSPDKPQEPPESNPAYTSSVQPYKPEDTHSVALAPSEGRLSKRASWHKPVFFINPFVPGLLMCGWAEWEKRGQVNSEIRIDHLALCGVHINHGENIGIPF